MIAFADSTGSTYTSNAVARSDGTVVFRNISRYTASTNPALRAVTAADAKKAWKAKMREECRVLTLLAQAKLSKFHGQEQGPKGHQWRTWHKRPGRRHTCTAVRNFRRR